jgi:hypothetical protein
MRLAALIGLLGSPLLTACGAGDECRATGDSNDCPGDQVCARSSECLPADQIRQVSINWTVRGQAASATTCAPAMSLYLLFYSDAPGDSFGYSPVPCVAGLFTIDKLPTRFIGVEIGKDGGFNTSKPINAQGLVTFDLMP